MAASIDHRQTLRRLSKGSSRRKNPKIAVALQYTPLLTLLVFALVALNGSPRGPLVFPLMPVFVVGSVWGLGYLYLGRIDRFVSALVLGWVVLPGAIALIVFMVMRNGMAGVALAFTAPLLAPLILIYLGMDARALALAHNARLEADAAKDVSELRIV